MRCGARCRRGAGREAAGRGAAVACTRSQRAERRVAALAGVGQLGARRRGGGIVVAVAAHLRPGRAQRELKIARAVAQRHDQLAARPLVRGMRRQVDRARQLARRAHALDLHDELAQPRLRLSALLVDGALERHRRLPPGTALAAAVRALRQLATHATERELLARFPGQRDLRAASLAERAASLAPEERGEAR